MPILDLDFNKRILLTEWPGAEMMEVEIEPHIPCEF